MIDTANHISIISPENGKPVMVDSTLNVNFAMMIHLILNM